jgi:hypothetical protein
MQNDNSVLSFQKLDIYIAAKEIARLVNEARIDHTELRDQARRASVSCFLQLAEGLPNDGPGMRRKYFTESNNSCMSSLPPWTWRAHRGLSPPRARRPSRNLGVRTKRMLRSLLNRPAG